MNLQYVPLLNEQRAIYDLPIGMERFQNYLGITADLDKGRIRYPFGIINPMAKAHVPACLDCLMEIEADRIAEAAMQEAARDVQQVPGDYRVTIVLADDLMGGWTNRYADEHGMYFPQQAPPRNYDWLAIVLWVTDPATPERVREQVVCHIYRTAYITQQGVAQTLRQKMVQEGIIRAKAGCTTPILEEEDLEYTRWVLEPFLECTDMRTAIECLYGDKAGATLGFTPRGLSDNAGIALALYDARKQLQVVVD